MQREKCIRLLRDALAALDRAGETTAACHVSLALDLVAQSSEPKTPANDPEAEVLV